MATITNPYAYSHHERRVDPFGHIFFVLWYTDGAGSFVWINA